jgi:hypothetical protein
MTTAGLFGKHYCHAMQCFTEVPPKMFMCKPHWRMLPKAMRDAIWDNYRPGQEIDKEPTNDYVIAASRAIAHIAVKEGKT